MGNQKQLNKKQFTDTLTGVWNRSKLQNWLDAEITQGVPYTRELSIIFFDVDLLGRINRAFGCKKGDEILIKITTLVSHSLKTPDMLARWWEDEFIMLLPDVGGVEAFHIAKKLQIVIAAMECPVVGQVTCSFGVSQFGENDPPRSQIKKVKELLKKAKENGRNRVEVG